MNSIDYVTYASAANAADFGDMSQAREKFSAAANDTYFVMGPGDIAGHPYRRRVEYVTIATLGNATEWGNTDNPKRKNTGSCSSTNRWLTAGGDGENVGVIDEIEYFTYNPPGSSSDFGSLSAARANCAGLSGD